jgi:hypothetical protein
MASHAATNTYSLPAALPHSSSHPHHAPRKSWQHRLNFISNKSPREYRAEELNQEAVNASARSKPVPKWWRIRLFRGMVDDVRRRAPFYWSDWADAWDYRVIPATVYMYFAKYVLSRI